MIYTNLEDEAKIATQESILKRLARTKGLWEMPPEVAIYIETQNIEMETPSIMAADKVAKEHGLAGRLYSARVASRLAWALRYTIHGRHEDAFWSLRAAEAAAKKNIKELAETGHWDASMAWVKGVKEYRS